MIIDAHHLNDLTIVPVPLLLPNLRFEWFECIHSSLQSYKSPSMAYIGTNPQRAALKRYVIKGTAMLRLTE